MATLRPATARGQRTRRRLVEAAEVVFGEKGYERASISDITREAAVALGTFYVYFPDKRALFAEVVDNLGDRLRVATREAIRGAAGRIEVERRGLEAFFGFARRHRLLYRIVRQAEFVDEDLFRRYYRGIAEPYARGLARAMQAGEVRGGDPESLAYCLIGIAEFLGMRYVLWGRGRGLDVALDAAVALMRRGIAAGSRPAVAARVAGGRRRG